MNVQLNQAFNQAKKLSATLEKPVTFTAKDTFDPVPGRRIIKGASVRVFHGTNHGYIIWNDPGDDNRQITYID